MEHREMVRRLDECERRLNALEERLTLLKQREKPARSMEQGYQLIEKVINHVKTNPLTNNDTVQESSLKH